MCSKGSWGDRRPLEVGLNVGVSWRDSDDVTPENERPENVAGCWYADRAEEEGNEPDPGKALEMKSSAGAGVCIATNMETDKTKLTRWQPHQYSYLICILSCIGQKN